MKQKVLICAALMHDPDIVIFDEPLSGLDVTSVLIFRSVVQSLAREGKIILFSSHVLEVIEKVCAKDERAQFIDLIHQFLRRLFDIDFIRACEGRRLALQIFPKRHIDARDIDPRSFTD